MVILSLLYVMAPVLILLGRRNYLEIRLLLVSTVHGEGICNFIRFGSSVHISAKQGPTTHHPRNATKHGLLPSAHRAVTDLLVALYVLSLPTAWLVPSLHIFSAFP